MADAVIKAWAARDTDAGWAGLAGLPTCARRQCPGESGLALARAIDMPNARTAWANVARLGTPAEAHRRLLEVLPPAHLSAILATRHPLALRRHLLAAMTLRNPQPIIPHLPALPLAELNEVGGRIAAAWPLGRLPG